MQFRYEAYNKDKRLVRGSLESNSEQAAEGVLYRAGFERITRLQSSGKSIDWRKLISGAPKVSKQVLLDFTNELAIMLESGLSLQAALKQMEKQTADRGLRSILPKLTADLKAGTLFNAALSAHPQVFSQTYISMIEANEKSGTLDTGLRQIAKELKQEVETKAQVQSALVQPMIIVGVALVVILVIVLYVLPKLVEVFKQFGANLPLTTRILIGVSNFFGDYKFYLLFAALAIVLGFFAFTRRPSGKKYIDRIMLKVPLVGEVILFHNTARFSRTLSNLLKAGILLPDAMNIIVRGMNNSQVREALSDVRIKLIQGQSLSAVLERNNLFPKFLVEMVVVGESSGQLETSLSAVADFFDTKVSKRIARLVGLLEPALILVLGLGVGFVAISMISTIYGLLGSVK
jgi:type IV pilus assembly protein PilC